MLRKKDQGVEWLEFELLADEPKLKHAIFLRHGGVSSGPFASLNVGGGTNDDAKCIEENRERVKRCMGVDELISGKQVHGKVIAHFEKRGQEVGDCDGLATDQKGAALMIKHADCQAAIIYDPILNVLANVHCGWRGNVQNIYAEAVAALSSRYGSKPENLLVGISPSLGPQNAEFKNYREELPESFWQFQIKSTYFNLWEVSRFQLLALGILPHHIQVASICTFDIREDYFSYRRDKVTGRNCTIALII
ncbi:MAG: peptidoglycan editing factor PgeF [Chlamydiales bacterium]|nr:peptidoglycan editing factor PgeF [Chlamydiales bacterium]